MKSFHLLFFTKLLDESNYGIFDSQLPKNIKDMFLNLNKNQWMILINKSNLNEYIIRKLNMQKCNGKRLKQIIAK